ncbi:MAG TPA: glycosyltransferase family 39 protein [Desulfobacteria bacterium]|nr:glycosyltransferase family 39 protein [Desulfobacteria bacterium]
METTPKRYLKIYLPLAGLVLVYLITRLTGLTLLPITSSEAMIIHWAQIVVQYPGEWLIASHGGQQPLYTWLNAVTLNIFSDPLVAGRWVSVLAGLASMTGLYFIGRDVFNRSVGFLAALIYIVVPYAFFYDRLAHPGGLLSAFGIWTLRWSLHIAQETRPRTKAFKILGMFMGAALLTRTSAWFLFFIPGMVFYFWQVHQRPDFWKSFGICIGIAFAMNLPVLLAGSFSFEGIFFSGELWFQNLMALRDIYLTYLTVPLILVLTASLVYLFRERHRVEKVLWLWFLIPSLTCLLLGSLSISSLYLITVPPLILLAAVACDRLAHFILITLRKLIGAPHHARTPERAAALGGFMVLVLFSGISWDLSFMRNPLNAWYPQLDRLNYLEGIHSGTGIREAAQFLAKEAEAFRKKTGVPLPVLLPMSPGNPAEGITVYLWKHPDVRFVPVFWWPKSPRMIPTGLRFSHRPSIYQTSPVMRRETTLLDYAHFIFPAGGYSREKFLQENPRFKQAWIFQRPGARGSIVVYKNHPKK